MDKWITVDLKWLFSLCIYVLEKGCNCKAASEVPYYLFLLRAEATQLRTTLIDSSKCNNLDNLAFLHFLYLHRELIEGRWSFFFIFSLLNLTDICIFSVSAHVKAQFVPMEFTLDWTSVNTKVIVSRAAVEKKQITSEINYSRKQCLAKRGLMSSWCNQLWTIITLAKSENCRGRQLQPWY